MPKNLFIKWSKDHEMGIPIIDEQHRSLVCTINTLFYLMREQCASEMLPATLTLLKQSAALHFLIEERMLELTKYPHAEEHKKAHDSFRTRMKILFAQSRKSLDPEDLLEFLKTLWMEHVIQSDHAFAPHVVDVLRKRGDL